ncbi:MAG: hypothetical protein R2737_16400 [Candidatus Nanopelagicales bacterium]
MDLSALPLVAVLRWDLAVRALLAVLLPALIGLAVPWLTHAAVLAAVVAALVSLSSLGPDLGQPRWTALAVVATPVAVTLGAWLAPTAGGGVLLVLLLFVVQGALTQAGLVGQLAWFPVSSAGLVAAALSPGRASLLAVAAAAAAGAAWAGLLVLLVPRVVRVPRLALPEGALAVDTPRLRRMVMRPHWRDWTFPLLLGGLSRASSRWRWQGRWCCCATACCPRRCSRRCPWSSRLAPPRDPARGPWGYGWSSSSSVPVSDSRLRSPRNGSCSGSNGIERGQVPRRTPLRRPDPAVAVAGGSRLRASNQSG